MASTRRMGSIDSPMGEAMLNAAQEILKEEGHASLTSRRIAEYLDVKQRLLYYYFSTMDDLVLETFKRLAIRELERLKSALASDQPLHEVWNICINTSDARLISEFMALSNRNEGVRDEVIKFIQESRKLQVKALKSAMEKQGGESAFLPAEALAMLGSSLALTLNREASLGIKSGHAAVKKVIDAFFGQLEP